LRDRLLCRRCVIPSFCHTDEWVFHPFIRELYDRLRPAVRGTPRHIFVSRKGEGLTSNRVLENRDFLEHLATARGYEVVRPQKLGFAEQFALFHDSVTIVGEAGSGMHTALVSEPGTIVASVTMANAIQLRIGELRGHHNVFMNRIRQWKDDAGVQHSEVRESDLRDMFDVIDGLR
jgi:capsular polysaccharide biosynthesis protein